MTNLEEHSRQLALTVLRLTDELLISGPLLSSNAAADLLDARAYARDVVADTQGVSEADQQSMRLRLERWGSLVHRQNRPER